MGDPLRRLCPVLTFTPVEGGWAERWRAAAAATAFAFLITLIPAGGARADRAEWESLAHDMAAPWPSQQESSGNLPDGYFGKATTNYGNAVMGYGLLQTGVREHDRRFIRSGLRALAFATRTPASRPPISVFEMQAVASAYNLGRREIPDDPSFKAIRSRLAS